MPNRVGQNGISLRIDHHSGGSDVSAGARAQVVVDGKDNAATAREGKRNGLRRPSETSDPPTRSDDSRLVQGAKRYCTLPLLRIRNYLGRVFSITECIVFI